MSTPQRHGSPLPHPEDGLLLMYVLDRTEISKARKFSRLSQRQLARQCDCSHTLIYKLERGRNPATDEKYARSIAEVLGFDWRSVFSYIPPVSVIEYENRLPSSVDVYDGCAQTIKGSSS